MSVSSAARHLRSVSLLAMLAAPLACGSADPLDEPSASSDEALIPCGATTIVTGDVVIATAADTVAYRCVTEIRGNLTVSATPEALSRTVDLFSLRSVLGDVSLTYVPMPGKPEILRAIKLGSFTQIIRDAAGPSESVVAVRQEASPTTAGRGGSLSVSIDFGTSVVGDVAFDLGALSRVDGDAKIEMRGGSALSGGSALREPKIRSGLDKLKVIHGSLTLAPTNQATPMGNVTLAPFLPVLETVDGDVTWKPSSWNEVGSQVLHVKTVGGDLVLEPIGDGLYVNVYFPFDSVATVGGTIRFRNMHVFARSWATARALEVVDSSLGFVGGAPTIQRLLIQNNPKLIDFQLEGAVVGSGPITIVNNPLLDQCKVEAYIRSQRASGWTGIATTGGNRPCQ